MITKEELTRRYNECIAYQKDEKLGGLNNYICAAGHITKTIEIDPGVTPFIIRCEFCGAEASSSFGNDISIEDPPIIEWYRPSLDEVLKILKHALKYPVEDAHVENKLEHILDGGLELRSVGEFYSLKPGDTILAEYIQYTVSYIIRQNGPPKRSRTVNCLSDKGERFDLTSDMKFEKITPDVKAIGKVYALSTSGIYVMCTGKGPTPYTFSGTIIHMSGEPTEFHQTGRYSDKWLRNSFTETDVILSISNANYKPYKEKGDSPG